MYKQLLSIIVSMIFVIIANPVSFAQMEIPQQLSYQGNLLESDKPVTGLKNFIFSFADIVPPVQWNQDMQIFSGYGSWQTVDYGGSIVLSITSMKSIGEYVRINYTIETFGGSLSSWMSSLRVIGMMVTN